MLNKQELIDLPDDKSVYIVLYADWSDKLGWIATDFAFRPLRKKRFARKGKLRKGLAREGLWIEEFRATDDPSDIEESGWCSMDGFAMSVWWSEADYKESEKQRQLESEALRLSLLDSINKTFDNLGITKIEFGE